MCGIVGIFGHNEAAHLTYLGLHALQHRGQESAGIVSSDGQKLIAHRATGHVADIFTEPVLASLVGRSAVGHVRYATAGGSNLQNAQPLHARCGDVSLAFSHNGNFVNERALRKELSAVGAIFQSDADTELAVHLLARSKAATLEARLVEALRAVEGAYAILVLSPNQLIAARDPRGFRPLVLGRLGDAYVLASETTALHLIEAKYVREVEPGEVIVIDEHGLTSSFPFARATPKRCIFELVYFARPDSTVFGLGVFDVRKRLGRRLAEEAPIDADVVIAVPDSGVPAAIGYAEQSGIPYDIGLIRSHYVGRTFIEPQQAIRNFGVKLKLAPVVSALAGKRAVVIDDSIVRGTTSRKIVKMLREAGAKEIHFRVSSPPTAWPCYYGIDTPRRRELIASSHEVQEVARFIEADTLAYLSLEGLQAAVNDPGGETTCSACFSGRYPTAVEPRVESAVHIG